MLFCLGTVTCFTLKLQRQLFTSSLSSLTKDFLKGFVNQLKKNSDLFFLEAVFTKIYFLVNLKSEMEAGDLAVIGADDLDTQTHIFVKLRPHTIWKSTRHCSGQEIYFDSDGPYVNKYFSPHTCQNMCFPFLLI